MGGRIPYAEFVQRIALKWLPGKWHILVLQTLKHD